MEWIPVNRVDYKSEWLLSNAAEGYWNQSWIETWVSWWVIHCTVEFARIMARLEGGEQVSTFFPRMSILYVCFSIKWVKLLSRVPLFRTPWTIAYQAPPSMGFSRQGYWSGLPFPTPGYLPDPGMEPRSPALQADTLPSEPLGKVHYCPVNTFFSTLFLDSIYMH